MNVDDLHDKIIEPAFKRFDGKLDKLYDKLFEDNGGDCLQSQVNANRRWIKGVCWFIGTLFGVCLAMLARMII